MSWTFELLAGLNGVELSPALWNTKVSLLTARGRTLSFPLKGPPVCSFGLDGRSEESGYLDELACDVRVTRSGSVIYRGRVVGTSDTLVSGGAHEVSVSTIGYRGLLKRRILLDGDSILNAHSSAVTPPGSSVDQELIGWELIQATQSRDSGDLGITRGTGQTTGESRYRSYEAGAVIGDMLDNLSQVENGFDYDITPDLVYQVWYPTRDTSFPGYQLLDLGGLARTVSRAVESSTYANVVRFAGGSADNGTGGSVATVPVVAGTTELAAAFDPTGRWEVSLSDSAATLQTDVAQRAQYEYEQLSTLTPSWSVTLNTELWSGPDDLWVGDTANLVMESGRLSVSELVRVLQVDIAITDTGVETVTATLGKATPIQRFYVKQDVTNRRLDSLEQR